MPAERAPASSARSDIESSASSTAEREDTVAIVDEEAKPGIKREAIPKLLDRPFSGGVGGEVPVHHSTCGDVEVDKDVDPLKRGGHYPEAREIFITADAWGSNSYRSHVWKEISH